MGNETNPRPGDDRSPRLPNLQRPSEIQLLQPLARGLTATEAARELGVANLMHATAAWKILQA